ncbi:hypothetical protein M409DRAFT_58921 [Zasmidium cellare ATCC 36951]|uniref:DUF1279 domain-containing protein n=1 Tax=Zasmidium cellare ATCC 36951 TaxID=1080233 RepID=A0A6A6C3C5_ZASCE|nr:uncharacterized protein M409DRAFT_58921 [Zasmidium cellare ATCC 36951]KAF2161515.1 hypothetical protein M409DRAFT_58921 [Zasmidium cellare ATCC 36951]
MLTNSRVLQLLRQPVVHEGFLATSLRRNFAGQLPKLSTKTTPLRRGFTTSNLRISNRSQLSRLWRKSPLRNSRQTRHSSTQTAGDELASKKSLSLSERMKEMSRKYGWIVVGIYLGLSVLDFPFCFLAVRWFGTERIAEIEHTIIDSVWGVVEKAVPSLKERREQKEAIAAAEDAAREGGEAVMEDAKKHEDASIWTQLLLAYGVHKSLLFIRIPVTLAVTPKVVKTLRSWGWNIGKTKPK